VATTDSNPGGNREEELLRINAELAAEIRSLSADRTSEPRSSAGPAARRVSRLFAERDALAQERDALAAECDASRAEIAALGEQNEAIGQRERDRARQVDELSHEVNRLRGGVAGFLRRARARLLRR
jgi:chromosome segregation ATPase